MISLPLLEWQICPAVVSTETQVPGCSLLLARWPCVPAAVTIRAIAPLLACWLFLLLGTLQGTRHAEFIAVDSLLAEAGGDLAAARFHE